MELTEKIINSCILAKESVEKAGERDFMQIKKKKKLRTLSPGDKVLILLHEKPNKLLISWKGT